MQIPSFKNTADHFFSCFFDLRGYKTAIDQLMIDSWHLSITLLADFTQQLVKCKGFVFIIGKYAATDIDENVLLKEDDFC